MRVCAGCGKEPPGEFPYCPFCGAPQKVASTASTGLARKVVSVLFCDLVGSTSAGAKLDPEDVGDVLRSYHRAARSIVERHGGAVEKFVGDGVFAVFGFPLTHEDDAERSVRAALAMCATATDLPGLGEDDLHVRCAVTTGEVLVELDVDPAGGENFVVGAAANLAGRLQALAPIDGVVVDGQTFRLTENVFDYVVLEPAKVKGIDEPLEIFQPRAPLVAVRAGGRPELPSPLIGREEELRELTAAYAEVVATGRSRLVTVSGEPGLGKSRLVSTLQEQLLARDPAPVWRIGRSLPYGEGIGVWAFAEILKSHAGILESDDASTALARLDASLPDVPYRDWMQRRLLPILGLGSSASGESEEVLAAYRRFIELLAQERPAVVVFEDIHWADDGLLKFFAGLVQQPTTVPLLVIGTTRPELLEQGGAAAVLARDVVRLAPLTDADIANLAGSLLAGGSLAPEVEQAVLRNAGGNPLYAGEFVRFLLDCGALVEDGGVWRLAEGEPLAVPESMQALIAARVDVLPPTERAVLGDAAVVGGTFWVGPLAAVGNRPVAAVVDALEDLSRRHYVVFAPESTLVGEIEVTFTHGLVRDAVYAQLTQRDRGEKHARVARWLEQAAADRVDLVDILAYHTWTALGLQSRRGGAPEALRSSALRYATLAAERNVALDVRSAALHLGRAVSLSEDGVAEHTKLLALRGQLALHEGRPEEAVELLEQSVAAFQGSGRSARRGAADLVSRVRVPAARESAGVRARRRDGRASRRRAALSGARRRAVPVRGRADSLGQAAGGYRVRRARLRRGRGARRRPSDDGARVLRDGAHAQRGPRRHRRPARGGFARYLSGRGERCRDQTGESPDFRAPRARPVGGARDLRQGARAREAVWPLGDDRPERCVRARSDAGPGAHRRASRAGKPARAGASRRPGTSSA